MNSFFSLRSPWKPREHPSWASCRAYSLNEWQHKDPLQENAVRSTDEEDEDRVLMYEDGLGSRVDRAINYTPTDLSLIEVN